LVVPDEYTAQLLRHPLSIAGDEIAIDVQKVPMSGLGRALKRANDIYFRLLPLPFLSRCSLHWSRQSNATRQDRSSSGKRETVIRDAVFGSEVPDNDGHGDGDIINQACKNDSRVTHVDVGSGRPASTNFRSCSMCCAARCH